MPLCFPEHVAIWNKCPVLLPTKENMGPVCSALERDYDVITWKQCGNNCQIELTCVLQVCIS
jgi:hypothetical protein